MSTFEGSFREKNTIVGNNSYFVTIDVAKACNQSLPVVFLELVETASIQYATQHSVHVERLLVIDWNNTVQVVVVIEITFRLSSISRVMFIVWLWIEILHN